MNPFEDLSLDNLGDRNIALEAGDVLGVLVGLVVFAAAMLLLFELGRASVGGASAKQDLDYQYQSYGYDYGKF